MMIIITSIVLQVLSLVWFTHDSSPPPVGAACHSFHSSKVENFDW